MPFLLKPQDKLEITTPGKAVLTKSGVTITVTYSPTAHAEITKTTQKSGKQHVEVLTIKTRNKLSYTIATN
ncbi:MAG: hypothetical protein EOP47_19655 [Sphingobacteriaceae bacterium]|nr:MAG: hypothetical protein EOP47_19655 [Sphingobacteriaceae bacterium]